MHQSPQKQLAGRRDKYGVYDSSDAQAERRMLRGSQHPKARRHPRDEDAGGGRAKPQHPRG